MAVVAFLGLGSNLVNRFGELQAAVDARSRPTGSGVGVSRCGRPGGGWSSAARLPQRRHRIETDLSARDLLDVARRVEARLGRIRRSGGAPARWTSTSSSTRRGVDEPDLVWPHPRMSSEPCPLPLLDLEPEPVLPYGTRLKDVRSIQPGFRLGGSARRASMTSTCLRCDWVGETSDTTCPDLRRAALPLASPRSGAALRRAVGVLRHLSVRRNTLKPVRLPRPEDRPSLPGARSARGTDRCSLWSGWCSPCSRSAVTRGGGHDIEPRSVSPPRSLPRGFGRAARHAALDGQGAARLWRWNLLTGRWRRVR